ncbi:MAG: MGMT family protein [Akkermansiaceae bacterium]|jgi:methylated-DNA-[protein]-cysteine S-methyltransferase|tara:strand:- start:13 stop:339 length:327 start_codon:yes stop_codon:yes gene_type:complete
MKRSPTDFEQRVYDLVSNVPAGKVVTYAAMARELECGSAQAIGQALKRNPFAPKVPCHRVIKTDLTIGGYAGKTDGAKLKRKLSLLRGEGVSFDGQGKLKNQLMLHGF